MSGAEAASLALLLGFLVLSAFFSSSEAAFLSLQRTRIAHLLSEGVPGARRVANMLNEPERLLSTILLGNNLVNVAFSAIITVVVVNRVGQENEGLGVVIATILGTVTLLLLGETIPKTIAFRNSERIAFLYSYPLKWGEFLLLPFVLVLQWITKMLSRRVGGSQDDQRSITEGEFRALIDIGVGEGEFEQDEAERLKGVFRFGDRQVRDVMTPRTEIVFVQRGSTVKEFLTTYAEHSHTRFPVYWDTTDNVVGVLSLKDILRSLAVNGLKDEDSVTNVIRDVHFVPETKRIAEVFDELRKSGNQMAIAVDEFGGVAGLVTLKQLIEDVMGRVGEEGVGTEEEMTLVGRDTYEVDGGMSIDEARDRLELDIEEGDFETVAGWALERLGHIPA
ncbi:MAG: HlyC/CorC family transporter, partial [Dehalococcoidia bacterium]|nr:HlyC/CorC family transporter [Dehalococcoidia bacterium]